MKISNKFFGSVLLIAGTSIGAGMLGMPAVTSFSGFLPSFLVFLFVWIYMLITAFLFLDVNLSFEGNINFITMAEKTLGFWGKAVTWIFYLLLLYSLTAAYMAGSAPLFAESLKYLTGFDLINWIKPLPLLVFFGVFIYLGPKPTDYINRILMAGLVFSYLFIAIFLPSHTELSLLKHFDFPAISIAITLIFTSFGFC